jgi:hypothetical protein
MPFEDHVTFCVFHLFEITEVEARFRSGIEICLPALLEHRNDVEPFSEQARQELAQRLGQCPGKPLSEIIIEERGPL